MKMTKSLYRQMLDKAFDEVEDNEYTQYVRYNMNNEILTPAEIVDVNCQWAQENCLCNHGQNITHFAEDVCEWAQIIASKFDEVLCRFGF